MRGLPEFKGPIEGFTVRFLTKNFWRVQASMEFEDAMQEARCVFYKVIRKYKKARQPQHVMALYKTAWSRRFTDLAHRDNNQRTEMQVAEPWSLEQTGELDSDSMLLTMLQQAPAEVKTVLSLFLNAPSELLELAVDSWRGSGHYSPEGNKMLCLYLGYEPGTDIIGIVREYFS